MNALKNISIVFKRELKAQFNSMLAYVFIVIFVLLSMSLTFLLDDFLYMSKKWEIICSDILPNFELPVIYVVKPIIIQSLNKFFNEFFFINKFL